MEARLTRLTLLPPYVFLNRANNVKLMKKMSELFITRCDGFSPRGPAGTVYRVHMFFVNIFVLFNCDKPVYIRKTICCY